MKYGKLQILISTTLIIVIVILNHSLNFDFLFIIQPKINEIFEHIGVQKSYSQQGGNKWPVDNIKYLEVEGYDQTLESRVFLPYVVFSPLNLSNLPITRPGTSTTLQGNSLGSPDLPSLATFIEKVSDGIARSVRGVYVDDRLALQVIQQPLGDYSYVSNGEGFVTEFQNAGSHGSIGLLAHNHLSGRLFFDLKLGDEVVIVFGDRHFRTFLVTRISRYQRVERDNIRSDFIDLSNGERISSAQLFQRYYKGEERVTFQTCIEYGEILDWGLIFIEAIPVGEDHTESMN
jgi:hypothetical protein